MIIAGFSIHFKGLKCINSLTDLHLIVSLTKPRPALAKKKIRIVVMKTPEYLARYNNGLVTPTFM